jgi:hypothetical protein
MEDRVRRWLRSHPKVQVYVTRDEYERVMKVASVLNLSVSEVVKRAVLDFRKLWEEAFMKGCDVGYGLALERVRQKGPYTFLGIEEFAVPCFKCGKPVVLSSRNKEVWEKEVKPLLLDMFFHYMHKECAESSESPAL